MSRLTKMWERVVNEKLLAKTNVSGVDLSLNDKGRISAKGKIGGLDVSANSDGHAQATGKIAGGTMSTAVNKDGDGGYAFNKGGKTVSHTAGARDAWVSKGPNQPSQRVALNNSKVQEDDHEMSDDEYQRILMRKSTSKSLGSAPPTYDQKKFDNYSKANKRGAYSNSKVRQSVDFDDDLDEEWYNPTTWFNDDDEDKLNSLIAQDKKDKKPSYRKGISSKTQNAICSNPDLKAMNPKACESKGNTMKTKQNTNLKENLEVTKEKDGPYRLFFNDEVVGEYDTIDELKLAHEYVINSGSFMPRSSNVKRSGLPRYSVTTVDGEHVLRADDEVIGTYSSEPELRAAATEHMNSFNEGTELNEFEGSPTAETEWKIVINGNVYDAVNAATEDEAVNKFWEENVEKEGIENFLGDMIFAEPAEATTSNEDLDSLRKRAGITEAVDYDEINLAKYLRHKKAGTLGSTGPKGPDGTSFSPNRWDKYADMSTKQDEPLNYDDIGMEEPVDEPLNYDDIGMEDPDEVYQTVALNKLQAKEKADADAKADLDKQAAAQAAADAKAAELAQARAEKVAADKAKDKTYVAPRMDPTKRPNYVAPAVVGKKPMDTAKADKDLSPGQLKVRRAVQDKYGLDKTKAVQDLSAPDGDQQHDLIKAVNKPKNGQGIPGITGSTISGNANIADPVKTKGAQNTDDFGYDLDADSNFAGQTRTPKSFDRNRKMRNMQLNRASGMESKENDANLIAEMDRMLRIAGLK